MRAYRLVKEMYGLGKVLRLRLVEFLKGEPSPPSPPLYCLYSGSF